MADAPNHTLTLQETCRIYPVILLVGSRATRKKVCATDTMFSEYDYIDVADASADADLEQELITKLADTTAGIIIADAQMIPALQEALMQRSGKYGDYLLRILQQADDDHSKKLLHFFRQFDSWIIQHTVADSLIDELIHKDEKTFVQADDLGITVIAPSFTYLLDALNIPSHMR